MKTGKYTEEEIQKQLEVLAARPDSEIDYSDIPQLTGKEEFYRRNFRPIKKAISVRIDMDVLEWLKQHDNYSALINKLCRESMYEEQKQKTA